MKPLCRNSLKILLQYKIKMIVRLDNNTITEIKKKSFLNDTEYYKYLMINALNKSPKFIYTNGDLKKKSVNNILNNSDVFIKKFIN